MSTQINDGGPAFPMTASTGDPRDGVYCQSGLSLRDYFASRETLAEFDHPTSPASTEVVTALAGPKPSGSWYTNTVEWMKWEALFRARTKYIRADAMLKARDEPSSFEQLRDVDVFSNMVKEGPK